MPVDREISLSAPDITEAEINAVTAVMQTPRLSLGPKLAEFEKAFATMASGESGKVVLIP